MSQFTLSEIRYKQHDLKGFNDHFSTNKVTKCVQPSLSTIHSRRKFRKHYFLRGKHEFIWSHTSPFLSSPTFCPCKAVSRRNCRKQIKEVEILFIRHSTYCETVEFWVLSSIFCMNLHIFFFIDVLSFSNTISSLSLLPNLQISSLIPSLS